MIRVFLSGFSFGMLLQLAVGPVCLSVLSRSAACGRLEGCKMACGVVLADVTYIVLAAAGAAQLLSVLLLRRILLLAGAAIIFGFGLASIRAKADDRYVQSTAGSFLLCL